MKIRSLIATVAVAVTGMVSVLPAQAGPHHYYVHHVRPHVRHAAHKTDMAMDHAGHKMRAGMHRTGHKVRKFLKGE